MDVEMPARYFFSEVVDCYHDFDGECEDCGLIVPEWSLLQCQYGFCGKFFCQNCGFRCRRCSDYESRAVSLCSSHARLVYPSCDGCKNQFCDVCTDISVTQVSRKNVLSLYTVTWRITVNNKFVQCSSFLVYIAESCNQQQHRLFSCTNTKAEIFRVTAGNIKF